MTEDKVTMLTDKHILSIQSLKSCLSSIQPKQLSTRTLEHPLVEKSLLRLKHKSCLKLISVIHSDSTRPFVALLLE